MAEFCKANCEECGICTLDQLQPGQLCRVRRITGKGALRRRLMEMGLVKGVKVEVLKRAPLGDPVEYKLLGYHLSMRKSEASLIEVEQG